MNRRVFVVAVSGGVDSVVLLDMLARRKKDGVTYIIAHFDHGIRADSASDAEFVRNLAQKLEFHYELGEGKLGKNASESLARDARYAFLREVSSRFKAEKIITAHHQDDLLETIILNLLRGSSPRGLAPMQGQIDILRPLLQKRKSELMDYAVLNKLQWREDSTNSDVRYLRNYVRLKIMPELEPVRQQFLEINAKIENIYHDIDMRVQSLTPSTRILPRARFVILPYSVQREVMRSWLLRTGVESMDRQQLERLVIAAKTLPTGKRVDCGRSHWLVSERKAINITVKNVEGTTV